MYYKNKSEGLYYFNARWYDPQLGRFISQDPIRDGMNWYSYVRNNPLKYTDPTGLRPAGPTSNPNYGAMRQASEARSRGYSIGGGVKGKWERVQDNDTINNLMDSNNVDDSWNAQDIADFSPEVEDKDKIYTGEFVFLPSESKYKGKRNYYSRAVNQDGSPDGGPGNTAGGPTPNKGGSKDSKKIDNEKPFSFKLGQNMPDDGEYVDDFFVEGPPGYDGPPINSDEEVYVYVFTVTTTITIVDTTDINNLSYIDTSNVDTYISENATSIYEAWLQEHVDAQLLHEVKPKKDWQDNNGIPGYSKTNQTWSYYSVGSVVSKTRIQISSISEVNLQSIDGNYFNLD